MKKVMAFDYEGALADFCCNDLGVLEAKENKGFQFQGFLLRERGVGKRFMGDLQGALKDLTAALEVFSEADVCHTYEYNTWKHRGFVNFLLGDLHSAKNDGTMALRVLSRHSCKSVVSPSFGEESVTYLHFRMKGTEEILEERREAPIDQVIEMVLAGNFIRASAIWEDFDANVTSYHNRIFFLEERGIWKRLGEICTEH